MTNVMIEKAANQIAGALFGDATGTLVERLRAAIDCQDLGTDGDLTREDREALRLLLDAAITAETD